MDDSKVFAKIIGLYKDYNFFWKEKEISHEEVLSTAGVIIDVVLRKANLTYRFLFEESIPYSRKRVEGSDEESLFIRVDKDTFFILLLIIIDILEEATLEGDNMKNVHLDKFLE